MDALTATIIAVGGSLIGGYVGQHWDMIESEVVKGLEPRPSALERQG